jgi:Anti-sigma factor NepR
MEPDGCAQIGGRPRPSKSSRHERDRNPLPVRVPALKVDAMNAVNGYRAKAWERLSLAETMNDPERRADVGDHLRELYQPVSNEIIPPRLADLLRRLDQSSNGGRREI